MDTAIPSVKNLQTHSGQALGSSGLKVTFLSLQLKDHYGPVFTVRLGPTPVVVLCGAQAVRETLVDQADAFGGRKDLAIFEKTHRGYGEAGGERIAFSQGERWRTLRRFALTTLRDLGLGRRSLEERILGEVGCLERELERTCGESLGREDTPTTADLGLSAEESLQKSSVEINFPFSCRPVYLVTGQKIPALQERPLTPTFTIRRSTANIICSVVFGSRFHHQDENFKTFLGLLAENLKQMDTCWVQGDPHSEFNQENLLNSALDIFFAGLETTSTTLRYGLLILLKFPQVTELIQQEIDRVVGPGRWPCLGDRPRMPYTEAALHEIQRFADIMPLGVPRAVTRDTEFCGYHIPKREAIWRLRTGATAPGPPHSGHTVVTGGNRHRSALGGSGSDAAPRCLDLLRRYRTLRALISEPPTLSAYPRLLRVGGSPSSAPRPSLPADLGTAHSRRMPRMPGRGSGPAQLFLYLTWLLQRFSPTSPRPPAALHLQPRDSGFGKQPPPFQLILQPRQHYRPKDTSRPDSPPPLA
ncbi:cytochrome P450 2B6-like [Urocitellus parryii]